MSTAHSGCDPFGDVGSGIATSSAAVELLFWQSEKKATLVYPRSVFVSGVGTSQSNSEKGMWAGQGMRGQDAKGKQGMQPAA